jgi:NTE family protein
MSLPDSFRSHGNVRHLRDRRPPAAPGPVAFVFPGGGSLGAPQVGMVRALAEAGLVPDLVIGTSAGALNAVAFATDPSPAGIGRLESVWMSLRRRHVAPFSVRTALAAVAGRGDGLVPNSALRGLIERAALAGTLRGTSIPAHVVATDLSSGAAVVLSGGETVPALLASCAFPGLYAPVELGGRLLVDGGVSADVPVLQAEALGAQVTYVLPAAGCDAPRSALHGPMPLAHHALHQLLVLTARNDIAACRGPVHVLPAPASQAASPVDFRDTARLIDEGYRLAVGWLADHPTQAVGTARTVAWPAPAAVGAI